MRRKVFFNGKFYSGGVNGVHRVADRLIREVDRLVADQPEILERYDFRLLAPARRAWSPSLSVIELDEQPLGHTQFWEQAIAPWAARGGLLVNLCNLSPVLHPRKITLLHDAQFFLYPGSYPFKFQLGYRLLTPLMAATSRQVLTVSQFSRDMLHIVGVSPRGRTQIIHNGADHVLDVAVDPEIVDRLGLRPGRFVLMFGSAMGYKNVEVVFSAFNRAPVHDLQLVIVGADRAQLENAGLKPPSDSVFAGFVDDPGLRALYAACLCLAYPSRTEGFGLPPLEAMFCGSTAVAAPTGAIPEVCRDAVLYADPDRPEDWVECFGRLAADAALRQAKREQGAARAAQFTWDRAGKQLLETILRHAAPTGG